MGCSWQDAVASGGMLRIGETWGHVGRDDCVVGSDVSRPTFGPDDAVVSPDAKRPTRCEASARRRSRLHRTL